MFINEEASKFDVEVGDMGNCWLLVAIKENQGEEHRLPYSTLLAVNS